MLPFESSFDYIPLTVKELEYLFYQLEFSNETEKREIISLIARKIPWTYSIYDMVDRLNDPALRLFSRGYAHRIQIERTFHSMRKISDHPSEGNMEYLEEGVFLLSSVVDKSANYLDFKNRLDSLAKAVRNLYHENKDILTDQIKLHLLSRVLYQQEGFIGNTYQYKNPNNSLMTIVLKTKLGIPISLSILQMLVAKRLGIQLHGANFPLHFMLYYQSEELITFIDPFNGGSLVSRDKCTKFLRANGFEDKPEKFIRPDVQTILKRLLTNLVNVYKSAGNAELEDIFTQQFILLH
jgi:regulator of sirC expression with transglutaminase-like and TPR domain